IVPTARELLEQADALMRRNRLASPQPQDDIPTLVDAVPAPAQASASADAGAVGGTVAVSGTPPRTASYTAGSPAPSATAAVPPARAAASDAAASGAAAASPASSATPTD